MTAIVGLVDGNDVYIGGDSLGTCQSTLSKSVRNDPKVFQVGPFIIGFTTSFRMGQILMYRLDPPAQTVGQTDYEYMVTSFVDAVKKAFVDYDFGDKKAGGKFLVGYKGHLYTVDSDYQVGIPAEGFDACGCGTDLCLGAVYATAGCKPEDRIRIALGAAATFSAGVGGPFNIIKLQGSPTARPVRKRPRGKARRQSK